MTVIIGQPFPDFVALATGDKTIHLSDLKGQYVLLYFYPKDNTPVCTLEGQAFRDHINEFNALNCVIFGVSRDSLSSHEKFKTKQCFPFDLISDHEEALCQLFDVIKMKSLFGVQVRGIERSSFLINPEGVLIKEWRKVKTKNHVQEVLAQLQQ